jgi:hypothetical protein
MKIKRSSIYALVFTSLLLFFNNFNQVYSRELPKKYIDLEADLLFNCNKTNEGDNIYYLSKKNKLSIKVLCKRVFNQHDFSLIIHKNEKFIKLSGSITADSLYYNFSRNIIYYSVSRCLNSSGEEICKPGVYSYSFESEKSLQLKETLNDQLIIFHKVKEGLLLYKVLSKKNDVIKTGDIKIL